ncbi:hypothetical protein OG756_04965 [Streptomyces sp. NBC_01310]|uniref:hypothetical protein n=1 Tax=Streptomyces sp. NBC_01310 TaxID=2903820 RepID=UPI0035B5FAD4|nr:hypothetical protein OG756_04965 [Streptomyces sp. NBC_01310]
MNADLDAVVLLTALVRGLAMALLPDIDNRQRTATPCSPTAASTLRTPSLPIAA